MVRRWLNNSRLGHWLGLHSPSRLLLGACWCQRRDERRRRLRKRVAHWVWDGWPTWKPYLLERAVLKTLCRLYGHTPIADNCAKPAHDFCVWCGLSMPHQASVRGRQDEEDGG